MSSMSLYPSTVTHWASPSCELPQNEVFSTISHKVFSPSKYKNSAPITKEGIKLLDDLIKELDKKFEKSNKIMRECVSVT